MARRPATLCFADAICCRPVPGTHRLYVLWRLTVSVLPTPDNLLTATLQNWQPTYACVPSE